MTVHSVKLGYNSTVLDLYLIFEARLEPNVRVEQSPRSESEIINVQDSREENITATEKRIPQDCLLEVDTDSDHAGTTEKIV